MAGEIKINDVSIATESGGTVTLGNATLGSTVVLGTNASPIASNLVLAAGNGIDFSAASGSAAGSSSAVLDDYEEGTWTPTIMDYTGSYTTQLGTYVKVGGKVYVAGRIITTGGTGSFGAYLSINNLPFTGSHNITSPNLGTWTQVAGTQSVPSTKVAGGPIGGPNNGSTHGFMNSFDTSGNSGNWSGSHSNASVNCEFRFHLTYFTA